VNRRKQWLLAAAGLLVVLNAWHWWPKTKFRGPAPATVAMENGNSVRVEQFVIQGAPGGKLPPTQRDVFQPKRPPVVKAPPPKKPPEPPPKSAEELAREAAQAEYATIRCLAVVFRDGRGQALMSVGPLSFHVAVGEKVGNRFVVNKIESDGVRIEDAATGVGGKISLSGGSR